MTNDEKCPRCDGCGKIADDEEGAPLKSVCRKVAE
jgi:hypothetical protein